MELENEQDEIIKARADLASYIKFNGIMYYNPDLEEYLDLLIKEEEDKKGAGANNSRVLDGLRNVKDELKAQIKIYEESLRSSSGAKSSNDINKILKDLSNLKINDNFFKNNDAFRFLAAYKTQGVKFEQHEIDGFRESWKKSQEAAENLNHPLNFNHLKINENFFKSVNPYSI